MKLKNFVKEWFVIILALAFIGVPFAYATLTFNGSSVSGDGVVTVDGANSVNIGTSTATGINIGKTGITTSIAGTVKFPGLSTVGTNYLTVNSTGVVSTTTAVSASPSADIPAFVLCNAVGCGDTQTVNNWFVSSPTGITFDECGADIAVAPTVQAVKVDIQTPGGVSIFTSPITLNTGSTATQFNSTFANPTAAKGAQFKAVITQGDTGGAGQFVYVKCRTHNN
jgi:hypothetical protein